jgi:hypothetical protein
MIPRGAIENKRSENCDEVNAKRDYVRKENNNFLHKSR